MRYVIAHINNMQVILFIDSEKINYKNSQNVFFRFE